MIQMPVYVNGIPLQMNFVGDTPENSSFDYGGVQAYVTQNDIISVCVTGCLKDLKAMEEPKRVLTPDEALAQYEAYLNQLLVVPEEMKDIRCIRLEYNVWHILSRGNYDPEIHLTPVWAFYGSRSYECPVAVFHATTGEIYHF